MVWSLSANARRTPGTIVPLHFLVRIHNTANGGFAAVLKAVKYQRSYFEVHGPMKNASSLKCSYGVTPKSTELIPLVVR